MSSFALAKLERLRITFTPNGKREFVPRDEVFPLIVVYCILLQFLLKTTSCFTPGLSITIVLDSFHLLIFYSEKFSTQNWLLPFAVNVTLNGRPCSFFRPSFGQIMIWVETDHLPFISPYSWLCNYLVCQKLNLNYFNRSSVGWHQFIRVSLLETVNDVLINVVFKIYT